MKKDIKKIKFEFDGDDILPLKHKFYSMEFNDNSDYMECKTSITDYMVDRTPREYINSAMLKLNYYYATIPGYHLMDLASERDVDELAYEIIYFNKGTDELKKESKANICAMNELCDRYYYSNLYNEAFDLANEISLKGHKKAIYTKILCTYLGNGTQKNEEEAFNELNKYVDEHVYFKRAFRRNVLFWQWNTTKL